MDDRRRSVCDLAVTLFIETQLERGQIGRERHDACVCVRTRKSRQQFSRLHRRRESPRRIRVVLGTTKTVHDLHVRIGEELVEDVGSEGARGACQNDLRDVIVNTRESTSRR